MEQYCTVCTMINRHEADLSFSSSSSSSSFSSPFFLSSSSFSFLFLLLFLLQPHHLLLPLHHHPTAFILVHHHPSFIILIPHLSSVISHQKIQSRISTYLSKHCVKLQKRLNLPWPLGDINLHGIFSSLMVENPQLLGFNPFRLNQLNHEVNPSVATTSLSKSAFFWKTCLSHKGRCRFCSRGGNVFLSLVHSDTVMACSLLPAKHVPPPKLSSSIERLEIVEH